MKRELGDICLPNQQYGTVKVGHSPSYCTAFSESGRYFIASSKGEITVFDGSDPYSLKKTHYFLQELHVSWAVSDIDVLENRHIATYATLNNSLNILDLENGKHRRALIGPVRKSRYSLIY